MITTVWFGGRVIVSPLRIVPLPICAAPAGKAVLPVFSGALSYRMYSYSPPTATPSFSRSTVKMNVGTAVFPSFGWDPLLRML